MDIVINGNHEAGAYTTIDQLLSERDLDPKLVVVELNSKIVPKSDYANIHLQEGDVVEIVQFVSGG